MMINQSDYKEIMDYMVDQRWQGYEFVACLFWNGPVSKEELFLFDNRSEAKEFCEEHSTDSDRFSYLPTRSVYRSMSEALHDDSIMVEKGGLVDLLNMVNKYHEKLEERSIKQNNDLVKFKQKEEVMNHEVFDYLRKQMLYAGLGDVPLDELQNKLKQGKSEFQIIHKRKFGTVEATARLNFKQSEKNLENYFFNSFDVLFKKEGEKETMQQNFRISFGDGFRFDEAYKLMNGRSINKTFVMTDRLDRDIKQEVNATAYMDFKNVDKYGNFEIVKVYGYDLEKKLAEYPIKGFENESVKNKIVTDLKNGDVASCIMKTANGEIEMRMTANVQFDKLNLYDAKMKPLSKAAIKAVENKETVKQGAAKSKSKKQGADNAQGKKPEEKKPGEGNSKVIMKPDQGQDKSPSLRVG